MNKILGVKIDNLTQQECLNKIQNWLNQDQQRYIVTPNPEFILEAQKNLEFKRILNQADLSICDGTGALLASYFLKTPLKQRIPGADLMVQLCQIAEKKNLAVFLLGGEPGIALKASQKIKQIYPNLKIDYSADEKKIPKINQPSILFVALGAPKQEKWINANLALIPQARLAMGVGGSFDYLSGQIKRAPKLLRRIGLEWFWRLALEPNRLKRVYQATIKFPWLIAKEVIHR